MSDPWTAGRAVTLDWAPRPAMTREPLVSVVMPFKDAVAFLDEAAASVLAQSWSGIDLVLVDDGGTDGTSGLAAAWASRHPDRVRVVAHPDRANHGIGASRALGVRSSVGELVAFLDADDVWEPHHVAQQVAELLGQPAAGWLVSRAWAWHSWHAGQTADWLSPLAGSPGAVMAGRRLLVNVLRDGGCAPPLCGLLARRELLVGWVDELAAFPGMYEDQVLFSGLALRSPVVLSSSTGAWYRQHAESISAVTLDLLSKAPHDVGRREFLTWVRDQPETTDPEVQQLVDEELLAVAHRAVAPAARGWRVRAHRSTAARGARRLLRPVLRPAWGAVTARLDVGRARRAHPLREVAALHQYGGMLTGKVLVLGRVEDLAARSGAAHRDAAFDVLPLAESSRVSGPHHPWVHLPTSGWDVVVVADRAGRAWRADDVRHLRRLLAPGGRILVLLNGGGSDLLRLIRKAFDADLVSSTTFASPGPARRPLTAVRAFVPVGDGSGQGVAGCLDVRGGNVIDDAGRPRRTSPGGPR